MAPGFLGTQPCPLPTAQTHFPAPAQELPWPPATLGLSPSLAHRWVGKRCPIYEPIFSSTKWVSHARS